MSQQLKYTVDIVLCIDSTGSMGPVINDVKSNALRFYQDLSQNMQAKGKTIDTLRVRVVEFRDYFADGRNSMKLSDFFELPANSASFATRINAIYADGGGDEPESGLEALALAMRSSWNSDGDKKRQIIVVWTDASAHDLQQASSGRLSPNCSYPAGIPNNFDDLTDEWEGQELMSMSGKRLIIYSPDSEPWTDIANHWTNTIHYASQAGHGLSDIEYNTIIDAIANSI